MGLGRDSRATGESASPGLSPSEGCSATPGGPRQAEPAQQQTDPTQWGDWAQPAGTAQSQQVEAAGKQQGAEGEQATGDLHAPVGALQQPQAGGQQHGGVDQVVQHAGLPDLQSPRAQP